MGANAHMQSAFFLSDQSPPTNVWDSLGEAFSMCVCVWSDSAIGMREWPFLTNPFICLPPPPPSQDDGSKSSRTTMESSYMKRSESKRFFHTFLFSSWTTRWCWVKVQGVKRVWLQLHGRLSLVLAKHARRWNVLVLDQSTGPSGSVLPIQVASGSQGLSHHNLPKDLLTWDAVDWMRHHLAMRMLYDPSPWLSCKGRNVQ